MDMNAPHEVEGMGEMFTGKVELYFHPGWIVHGALMSFAVFAILPYAISLKFRAGYMHLHGRVQLCLLIVMTIGVLVMVAQPHSHYSSPSSSSSSGEMHMEEPQDLESRWSREHGWRGWLLFGLVWVQGIVGYGKSWVRIPCCAVLTHLRAHARFGYLLAFCLVLQAIYAWPDNMKMAICPKYVCFDGYPITGHTLVALPTMAAMINMIVTNWDKEVDPEHTFRLLNRGLIIFMGTYLIGDGLTYGFPNMGEHSMFIWNGIACYVLARVLAKKSASYPLNRVPYVLMFAVLGGSFLTDPHQLTDNVSSLIHKAVGAFFFVGGLLLFWPNIIPASIFLYLGGFCFLFAMPQLCKMAYFNYVMPYSYVSGVVSLGLMMLAFQLYIWVVPRNTERVALWQWPLFERPRCCSSCLCCGCFSSSSSPSSRPNRRKGPEYAVTAQEEDESETGDSSGGESIELESV